MDDLNQAISKIIDDNPETNPLDWSHNQQEEARLYYVAISRAKHHLYDADLLDYNPKKNLS